MQHHQLRHERASLQWLPGRLSCTGHPLTISSPPCNLKTWDQACAGHHILSHLYITELPATCKWQQACRWLWHRSFHIPQPPAPFMDCRQLSNPTSSHEQNPYHHCKMGSNNLAFPSRVSISDFMNIPVRAVTSRQSFALNVSFIWPPEHKATKPLPVLS